MRPSLSSVCLFLAVGLALLCLTILLAPPTGAVAAQQPILIGVPLPFSPPGSVSQGSEAKAGIELAAQMINEKGGILKRPVKLIFEDTEGVPEKGRAAVEKLITRDKVAAIVGANHSSVGLVITEVAHKYGVPFINVNCWSDAIREKGYKEVFNVAVFNSKMALAGAEMAKELGLKNVLAFPENTDFGIGLAKNLGTYLKEKSPSTNYKYEVLDREGKDQSPAILPLKSHPPDMVVTILDPPGGYLVINQVFEHGVAPTAKTWLLDLDALAELPDFWDNVGDGGKDLMGVALFHPKMKLTPLGNTVRERHMKATGREASRVVFQGFDALWVAADAINRAGSTKPAAVIAALEKTKLVASRGTITFDTKPGPTFQQWVDMPYAIIQFTKVKQPLAEAAIVYPPSIATAKPVKP
jgi:branched-chain amino acid transport system substrate-binding protein